MLSLPSVSIRGSKMNSQKITVETIRAMKTRGEKIAALTAYDFPMAKLLDEAGVPLILVGDSLGMVVLGYPDTTHVTMAEMEHHVRAAARAETARAARRGSAVRQLRDRRRQRWQTQKAGRRRRGICEGRRRTRNSAAGAGDHRRREFRFAGISACCRSTCWRKAAITSKAKANAEHQALLEDAQALADAGAFAIVLELVTPPVAQEISQRISIPDHRHRQRAGLRRADSGDARFDRHLSVVHAAVRETAGELRGGNQIGGGGVEKFLGDRL